MSVWKIPLQGSPVDGRSAGISQLMSDLGEQRFQMFAAKIETST